MTVKFGTCQGCDKEDLIGHNGCTGQDLCPECAAKFHDVEPEDVRAEYEARLNARVFDHIICKACGRPACTFVEDEPYCHMCAVSITR